MTETNNQSYQYSQTAIFDAPEGSSVLHGVFDRIETECIKPRSKWYFICKNDLFWGMGLLSIIVGSVAVAASLFAFSYIEFDYYTVTHDSLLDFLLDTLPIMWVFCFVVFLGLGYVQIRQTRRGYRYPLVIIMGSTLVLSLMGGTVLHLYGFGALLERAVGNRIPFHSSAIMEREHIWQNAPRGVIAGEVMSIAKDNSSFMLKDWDGKIWMIEAVDLMEMDLSTLKENKIVRVIGLPLDMNNQPNDPNKLNLIHACFILPWEDIAFNKKDVAMNNSINLSERNNLDPRSNKCRGVGPYQLIERLRAEAK